jgi:uncharacterized protein (TIGR02453 family)
MAKRSFTPELFSFLRDLRQNNDREWFKANRERYEQAVQEPALEFIGDFAPLLHEISPHFLADPRPVGGSLFRIHRDVRFSKDKSPYKTNTGVHFRHELGRDVHAPGFYLHLAPREIFVAAGIWHPDSATLAKIRDRIVADPDRWTSVTRGAPFADVYRIGGDSLKRAPAGYDPDHPLIDDLKRKDFVGVAELDEETVTADGFLDEYAGICRAAAPFVAFLCEAVSVPF